MTDRSLMDRLHGIMKIQPHDNLSSNQNSWSGKPRNLLPTENRIYAIKVSDGEHKHFNSHYQFISPLNKKKKILVVKKWIEKCDWKLPRAMILVSIIQVRKCLNLIAKSISRNSGFKSFSHCCQLSSILFF